MAITVPVVGSEVSVATFGAPVANEINRLTPLVDSNSLRVGGTWRRNANLPVSTGGWVSIPWDTEVVDTHSFLTPTSITCTIPTGQAGIYAVTASAYLSTQNGAISILVSGVSDNLTAVPDIVTGSCTVHWTGPLAVGNTISARVFQGTGATINAIGRLEVWKVSQ